MKKKLYPSFDFVFSGKTAKAILKNHVDDPDMVLKVNGIVGVLYMKPPEGDLIPLFTFIKDKRGQFCFIYHKGPDE
jgi:hypothetical protein